MKKLSTIEKVNFKNDLRRQESQAEAAMKAAQKKIDEEKAR
jgi:hypothetical protein